MSQNLSTEQTQETPQEAIEDINKSTLATSRTATWVKTLFVLIVLLFGALGGLAYFSYYSITQWQLKTEQFQQQALLEIEQQSHSATANLEKLGLERQQLIQQNLDKVQQQNSKITDTLAVIAKRRPNDWLIAEANYLVQLAGHKIWLESEPETAIALLKTANKRLAELSLPKLLPIRQAIQNDITTLELIPEDTLTSTLLQLTSLTKQVEFLPLITFRLPASEAVNMPLKVTADPNNWRQNLIANLNQFLDGFIKVRKRDVAVAPVMTAQQQWLAKQSLIFKLERAYGEALRRDQALYQSWLTETANDLQRSFDISDPSVRLFRDRLEQLSLVELARQLPSALSSVDMIQQQAQAAINPPITAEAQ